MTTAQNQNQGMQRHIYIAPGWKQIEESGGSCGMYKPSASGDTVLDMKPFSPLYGETQYDELINNIESLYPQ
ncbi:MAG TPA: hypothetical protein VGN53_00560 [Klebsiella sp.]|jgi:hypothetical protein